MAEKPSQEQKHDIGNLESHPQGRVKLRLQFGPQFGIRFLDRSISEFVHPKLETDR
jgi:hypothetical protein